MRFGIGLAAFYVVGHAGLVPSPWLGAGFLHAVLIPGRAAANGRGVGSYRRGFAIPIFIRARARPIVRMKRSMRSFWSAKTCSMAARTFDLSAFAFAVAALIGLPLGFLTMNEGAKAVFLQEPLIGR